MQNNQTSELDSAILKLQAEVKALEEHKRKVAEEERNQSLLELAKTMTFKVSEMKGDIFDTTEVVEVRLSPITSEYSDELSIYGSIGYIVSRKHKTIIGNVGGGYCLLKTSIHTGWYNRNTDFDESSYMYWIHKAAAEAMQDYLASL